MCPLHELHCPKTRPCKPIHHRNKQSPNRVSRGYPYQYRRDRTNCTRCNPPQFCKYIPSTLTNHPRRAMHIPSHPSYSQCETRLTIAWTKERPHSHCPHHKELGNPSSRYKSQETNHETKQEIDKINRSVQLQYRTSPTKKANQFFGKTKELHDPTTP